MPVIGLLMAAALTATPACVPSLSGGYLPTPSPCRVEIVDPLTSQPEHLVVRWLDEPRRMKPGKDQLREFYLNPRNKWRWLLLALVL